MLTNILRWLRSRVAGREAFPGEFRAERMDAGWQPEYLDLRGHAPTAMVSGTHLLHR
jgi:hypothetical protein